MGWYPCCCDQKNSLYVPCCLYGIAFRLFGRNIGGVANCKLKHLYLENMAGDVSADHGSVMLYGFEWSGVTYGSLSWYDWGLPITKANLYEPQPGGNWKIRLQFRNVTELETTMEITGCTLLFSFFNPLDNPLVTGFQQTIELYPESVGGGGDWTDTASLTTPGGTASILLQPKTNSPELVLGYGAIPYGGPGQLKTSISATRSLFLAFDFQQDGGTEVRKHCMEFYKPTTDPVRDDTGLAVITDCEVSPPCVECSCRAARPNDQETCEDCRCISNTPIKLGGFGEVNPEPSILDITGADNGVASGDNWTIYGHAKQLGPFITDQTIIWTGHEDDQGSFPATQFTLQRTAVEWRLWVKKLDNSLTYQEAADPGSDGAWFVWWIVKKKFGAGDVRYKFGIAVHSGGASVSDWITAADMNFPGPGSELWAILGDDAETSQVPSSVTSQRVDSSFAGCMDGLGFLGYAAEDQEMEDLAQCNLAPPP